MKIKKITVFALILSLLFSLSMPPKFIHAAATLKADKGGIFITELNEEGLPKVEGMKLYAIKDEGMLRKIKGLSYNKTKNRLILNKYKQPTTCIIPVRMGSDFKIYLKGNKNSVQMIYGLANSAYNLPTSMTFEGSGTLKVNANKLAQGGIIARANNTDTFIHFKKKSKIRAYSTTESVLGAVQVDNTLRTSKAITYKGKLKYKGKINFKAYEDGTSTQWFSKNTFYKKS